MLGLGLGLTGRGVLQGGTAAPVLWTPLDLGAALKAWWHADDTTNGAVTTWTSRVGSLATTATAGLEPISAATSFNSAYRGLTFDGTDDCLTYVTTVGLPTGATGGELWTACASTEAGATATARTAVRYGSPTSNSRGLQRTGVGGFNRAGITEGAVTLTDTAIDFAGPHILGGNWAGTVEGGRIDGRDTNPATATIATLATGTSRLRIGAGPAAAAANWWKGIIRHVMVTTTLTATEREKLEGWLAWDAGMTGNLPGGHPYKSAPP